jgi:hypothetical protein
MKELVSWIAKNLADEPAKVVVEQSEDDDSVRLKLEVAEGDKGRIIGKQGKVIKAIRALVAMSPSAQGRRTSVVID